MSFETLFKLSGILTLILSSLICASTGHMTVILSVTVTVIGIFVFY